jgi:hypothetical protein
MEQMNPTVAGTSPDWEEIRPLLDEAMEKLEETDREALLLRFFKNEDLRAVGAALGVSDDAAQKRVGRAVERLREIFAKRGLAVGAGGLTAAVSANAVQAAPAGLAAAFTSTVFAGAASGGISLSLWKLMTLTKIKLSVTAALVAASVMTSVVIQQQAQARMQAQDELGRQQSEQLAKLKAENERLAALSGKAGNAAANNLDNLVKLRAEVAGLRERTNALASVRQGNQKLRAAGSTRSTGGKTALEEQENATANAYDKMNYTRQWILAARMYAEDNNGQMPTNFNMLGDYFKPDPSNTNLSTSQFELLYSGLFNDIKDPSGTITIRELDATQTADGNWIKSYGFADGHTEIHSEPSGNFDDYEAKHTIPRPNQ